MKKSKNDKNLDSEQKVLDSMIKENPNIKSLINLLDLQIIKTKQNEYTEHIR
jgi:hypothetical protein